MHRSLLEPLVGAVRACATGQPSDANEHDDAADRHAVPPTHAGADEYAAVSRSGAADEHAAAVYRPGPECPGDAGAAGAGAAFDR